MAARPYFRPVVSFGVGAHGRLASLVLASNQFQVFLLGASQASLAQRLGGGSPYRSQESTPIAKGEEYHAAANSLVRGAIGSMHCRLQAAHEVGQHIVMYGVVDNVAINFQSAGPLLYYRKDFYTTGQQALLDIADAIKGDKDGSGEMK